MLEPLSRSVDPPASPPVRRQAAVAGVRRLLDHPYVLLALTALMWGGNGVASRLAVGEVSPMVLTTLRWVVACGVLLAIARGQFLADLPVLRTRWRLVVLMGGLGYTAFNALFYLAGHYTTAVNIVIAQGSIPIFVLLGAFAVYRTPIGILQVIGMALAIAGLVVVATAGEPARLRELAFNLGDLLMLLACLLYAGYTLALRGRPQVSGLGLFTAMALVAGLTSLPLLGIEMALGQAQWPTPTGWAVLLYVALGPSLLSQLFFMRGVEQIGPNRAGIFVNLVPVFGSILAVLILGERFALHHGLALALVLGGIVVAERARRGAG